MNLILHLMRSSPPICTVFYKHYNSHLLVWLRGCLGFTTGQPSATPGLQRTDCRARAPGAATGGRLLLDTAHSSCLASSQSLALPLWEVSLVWADLGHPRPHRQGLYIKRQVGGSPGYDFHVPVSPTILGWSQDLQTKKELIKWERPVEDPQMVQVTL